MTSTEALEKIRNYILNGDHKDGIIAPILNWCDEALEKRRHEDDANEMNDEDEQPKKDIFMNGMTVEEYVKALDDAHEASKGSKLVFKLTN